jgi:hypothetical protein
MQVEEFKTLVEWLTGRPVRTKPSDEAFLTRALSNDEATIDCSQFNELLLIANKDRIEEAFFNFFFVEKPYWNLGTYFITRSNGISSDDSPLFIRSSNVM